MYENVYMVIEWRSSIPFSNKKISALLRSYEYARTYIAETHDIDVSQSYHFSRKKENCAIFEKSSFGENPNLSNLSYRFKRMWHNVNGNLVRIHIFNSVRYHDSSENIWRNLSHRLNQYIESEIDIHHPKFWYHDVISVHKGQSRNIFGEKFSFQILKLFFCFLVPFYNIQYSGVLCCHSKICRTF